MRTVSELEAYLTHVKHPEMSEIKQISEHDQEHGKDFSPYVLDKYGFGVGSLIFTDDDKVILIERGKESRSDYRKLEGVGGALEGEKDLHVALRREIKEELGEISVQIDELLTVVTSYSNNGDVWILPIFLCRLVSGIPTNMEPDKCLGIRYLRLNEITENQLSKPQIETMRVYKERFGDTPYYKKLLA